MTFVLPYPSTPTNGSLGDATPILANEVALAQAISSFDGSQINAKTVVASALADSINPQLRYSENFANYVDSGCTWASVSGLNGTMTGGTIYVNGYRVIVSGVGTNAFTLSNDTYIDIDYLGNVYYTGVANNATAPSLTANSIRVAKVVTNGTVITTVTQTGVGSNNVQIYPSNPEGYGNWIAWTPNLTFTGGGSIGNGVVSGRYTQIGKTVHFTMLFTLGSTTSFAGLTNLVSTLPVTASAGWVALVGSVNGPFTGSLVSAGVAYNGSSY